MKSLYSLVKPEVRSACTADVIALLNSLTWLQALLSQWTPALVAGKGSVPETAANRRLKEEDLAASP